MNELKPITIVDTETTGLRPPYMEGGRRIAELACIVLLPDGARMTISNFIDWDDVDTTGVPPDELEQALNVWQARQRHPDLAPAGTVTRDNLISGKEAAQAVLDLTTGAHWVGAVPNFDTESITHLLWSYGMWPYADPWDYHLGDAPTFVAGLLGLGPHERSLDAVADALGLDLSAYTQHRALDDCLITEAILRAAYARHGKDLWGRPLPRS